MYILLDNFDSQTSRIPEKIEPLNMNEKYPYYRIKDIANKNKYILSDFQDTLPKKTRMKSFTDRNSLQVAQKKELTQFNNIIIDSQHNTSIQPFFVQKRSEMNQQIYPKSESGLVFLFRQEINKLDHQLNTKFPIRNFRDIVKEHSKGFQDDNINLDFQMHILRLLNTNSDYLIKNESSYQTSSANHSKIQLENNNNDDEEDIVYYPIELQEFILQENIMEFRVLSDIAGYLTKNIKTKKFTKSQQIEDIRVQEILQKLQNNNVFNKNQNDKTIYYQDLKTQNEFIKETLDKIQNTGLSTLSQNEVIAFKEVVNSRLSMFNQVQNYLQKQQQQQQEEQLLSPKSNSIGLQPNHSEYTHRSIAQNQYSQQQQYVSKSNDITSLEHQLQTKRSQYKSVLSTARSLSQTYESNKLSQLTYHNNIKNNNININRDTQQQKIDSIKQHQQIGKLNRNSSDFVIPKQQQQQQQQAKNIPSNKILQPQKSFVETQQQNNNNNNSAISITQEYMQTHKNEKTEKIDEIQDSINYEKQTQQNQKMQPQLIRKHTKRQINPNRNSKVTQFIGESVINQQRGKLSKNVQNDKSPEESEIKIQNQTELHSGSLHTSLQDDHLTKINNQQIQDKQVINKSYKQPQQTHETKSNQQQNLSTKKIVLQSQYSFKTLKEALKQRKNSFFIAQTQQESKPKLNDNTNTNNVDNSANQQTTVSKLMFQMSFQDILKKQKLLKQKSIADNSDEKQIFTQIKSQDDDLVNNFKMKQKIIQEIDEDEEYQQIQKLQHLDLDHNYFNNPNNNINKLINMNYTQSNIFNKNQTVIPEDISPKIQQQNQKSEIKDSVNDKLKNVENLENIENIQTNDKSINNTTIKNTNIINNQVPEVIINQQIINKSDNVQSYNMEQTNDNTNKIILDNAHQDYQLILGNDIQQSSAQIPQQNIDQIDEYIQKQKSIDLLHQNEQVNNIFPDQNDIPTEPKPVDQLLNQNIPEINNEQSQKLFAQQNHIEQNIKSQNELDTVEIKQKKQEEHIQIKQNIQNVIIQHVTPINNDLISKNNINKQIIQNTDQNDNSKFNKIEKNTKLALKVTKITKKLNTGKIGQNQNKKQGITNQKSDRIKELQQVQTQVIPLNQNLDQPQNYQVQKVSVLPQEEFNNGKIISSIQEQIINSQDYQSDNTKTKVLTELFVGLKKNNKDNGGIQDDLYNQDTPNIDHNLKDKNFLQTNENKYNTYDSDEDLEKYRQQDNDLIQNIQSVKQQKVALKKLLLKIENDIEESLRQQPECDELLKQFFDQKNKFHNTDRNHNMKFSTQINLLEIDYGDTYSNDDYDNNLLNNNLRSSLGQQLRISNYSKRMPKSIYQSNSEQDDLERIRRKIFDQEYQYVKRLINILNNQGQSTIRQNGLTPEEEISRRDYLQKSLLNNALAKIMEQMGYYAATDEDIQKEFGHDNVNEKNQKSQQLDNYIHISNEIQTTKQPETQQNDYTSKLDINLDRYRQNLKKLKQKQPLKFQQLKNQIENIL